MPLPKCIDNEVLHEPAWNHNIKYFKRNLECIGIGSSRQAFKMKYRNKESVIKVARNRLGVYQNVEELKYLTSAKAQATGILIPYIDHGFINGDLYWIQVEQASPIRKGDVKRLTGYNTIESLTLNCQNVLEGWHELMHDNITTRGVLGLLTAFPEICVGDLERKANWGIYRNRLTILDVGFNDVTEEYY